jgi:hypothetical protein
MKRPPGPRKRAKPLKTNPLLSDDLQEQFRELKRLQKKIEKLERTAPKVEAAKRKHLN